MGLLSVCNGYLKDTYRGGSKTVGISKVKAKGNDYTAQQMFGPGIEINPADGEQLLITKIDNSSSYMVTIAGTNQEIEPDTDRGERRIFSVSSDGKTIKAKAKFKNDGTIELNGATDSAVLFSQLQTAFDQLKSDFNNHTHQYSPGGGSPTPTPPPTAPSAADITPAESADVKLS